jgi:hypothetical protein
MTNLHDISEYISLSKGALDLLKSALGLMPKGSSRDEIERKVQAAEEILKRSDAKLAKELGMHLCQCEFPPPIMLSKGYHERHNVEVFECPACKKRSPSEHLIRQYDAVEEHNRGGRSSWIDGRRGR